MSQFRAHRNDKYRKISNISRTETHNLNVPRPVLQLSLSSPLKPSVKVEDDAPTTSKWPRTLLLTNVPLILQFWRYFIHGALCYNTLCDLEITASQ